MITKTNTVLSPMLAVFLVVGCSSSICTAKPFSEIPMVEQQLIKSNQVKSNDISVRDSLSVDKAILWAFKCNPELQVFLTEIKAREAHTIQESLFPNPELVIDFENFGGSGPMSRFRSTESTVAVEQLIELGGKRDKRTKIAALESDIALMQYEIKRLDIITQVRSIFVQVLVAQKKQKLNHQLLKISQAVKTSVDTLVKAGRLSGAESARAQVELSTRELILQRGVRELNKTRIKLSALWGSSGVDFTAVKGDLTSIKTVPNAAILIQNLENCPLLLEQQAVITKQKAQTKLARALAIPDPAVSAGYRRYNETDDQAFVAGLNIPLPIFDRNQGGRQEALLRERQSEQQLFGLHNQLSAEMSNRLEILQNLSDEIGTMQNIIIPEAQKAYDIIYQNYQMGKYAMIDVLDAQRQLFAAEDHYLDVLAESNLQVIELERLLGQTLK